MRLLRWGSSGQERPGILAADGTVRDLSGLVPDITGEVLCDEGLDKLRAVSLDALEEVPAGSRLGPPVGQIGKIVCIGLNYRDHAAEAGLTEPKEPIVFLKATSAIVGPNDPVRIPTGASKVDWEIELGIVIGRAARSVSREEALSYLAGYCIVNDVSERAWQMERGGQWDKGKCADTFAPIGPWLVTRDEVSDPQSLALCLDVDDMRRQDGTTADMIFDVASIVSYVSEFMSLQPGDVIATGTRAGVGMGFKPPVYLSAGQTMRLAIEGLGEQTTPIEAN